MWVNTSSIASPEAHLCQEALAGQEHRAQQQGSLNSRLLGGELLCKLLYVGQARLQLLQVSAHLQAQ